MIRGQAISEPSRLGKALLLLVEALHPPELVPRRLRLVSAIIPRHLILVRLAILPRILSSLLRCVIVASYLVLIRIALRSTLWRAVSPSTLERIALTLLLPHTKLR